MYHFAPSILSADFGNLKNNIDETAKGGADYLHFDVMDGIFVPSISFGMPVLKSLKKQCDMFMDVHLMIVDPDRYVEDFAKAGADLITIHYEAEKNIKSCLEHIHGLGLKAGLAVNPETDIEAVYPYLKDVDMILIMTVHPGFGGQSYIDDCSAKIEKMAAKIKADGLGIDLEVDGGIKLDNVDNVLRLGADVIVAGSATFGDNIALKTEQFVAKIESYKNKNI